MGFEEFLDLDFWARVGMCVLCGGAIGIERQYRGKPAGIRTSILITVGTMGFLRLGALLGGTGDADTTRVLGQVVTGIGFLGAGVMLTREGLVIGVTSAATIWTLAAIGASIGTGHAGFAGGLTIVTLGTLVGVHRLEAIFRWLRRGIYSDEHQRQDDAMLPSGLPRDSGPRNRRSTDKPS